VLHLFTGTHEQYHSPEDKAATLNAEGAARIAELTAVLASRVARGDATPVYARASAPPAREGDSRGYGAYLGTVPDYRSMEQETGGVLLADTRAGGARRSRGRAQRRSHRRHGGHAHREPPRHDIRPAGPSSG
jgi:hypothetical protein